MTSDHRRIVKNVSWNSAGTAVEMGVGFLLLPLLVSRLGNDGYGLWILIASLTGYFQFLDLGFRCSVGRFVAYHFALKDYVAICRVATTAAVVLSVMGAVAFLGITGLSAVFPLIVSVPDAQVATVQWALLIVGLHLGLWLVLRIFDAMLWGAQQFRVLNSIDSSLALVRLGATYFFVTETNGLIALATITLGLTIGAGLLKAWFSLRYLRHVRLSWRYFSPNTVRELAGFGAWAFAASVCGLTIISGVPIMIGSFMGLALVAPFAIARRLIDMSLHFLNAATGVLTPFSTTLHAKKDLATQRIIYLEGSKYCAGAALLACSGLCLLSPSFLGLWVGKAYAEHSRLVVILALGAAMPMATALSSGVLLAMAKHRCLALFGIIEVISVALLVAAFSQTNGLVGVCLALASANTLFHGVLPMLVACRELNVSLSQFLSNSLLPGLAVVALPASLLRIAVWRHEPDNWWTLLAYAGLFTISVILLGGATFYRRSAGRLQMDAPV